MKIILQLLIRYYINRYANKEIVKLNEEEEVEVYKLRSTGDILKVLKSNITIQTLRHFEATTDQERWMVKGAALALQLIKDRHVYAVKLESVKDKKKKLELWNQFKLVKK